MKKFRVFMFCLLSLSILSCTMLDDSGQSTQEDKSESARLLKEADAEMRAKRNFEGALELYKKSATQAGSEDNNSVRVEALAQAARMYSLTSRLEEGWDWLRKATDIATPAEPLGWSRYLGVRGIFERESKEKEKAVATFKEMYEFCVKEKLHSRAIDAAHHVAIAGTLEEQVEWGLKGIREAEAGGVERWLGPLWNNLGNTYDELERYEEALEAFEKSKAAHEKAGSGDPLISDWVLGKTLRKLGRLKKARLLLKDATEEARRRFEQDPKKSAIEWVGWCAWEVGELRLAEGEKAKGVLELKRGLGELEKAGMPSWGPYFEAQFQKMKNRLESVEND